jgi:dTDP-4-dehydrorhamnose reductase
LKGGWFKLYNCRWRKAELKMRVLLTGASGLLGGYLLRELKSRGLEVVGWPGPRDYMLYGIGDLAEPGWIADAFREVKTDLLIHAAALSRIDACFHEPEKARRVNALASGQLAYLAANVGTRMLHVSTDLVFDGQKGNYRESDKLLPLSVYGSTKRDAELMVLKHPEHVVARVSLLFGPSLTGRVAFFDQQLAALRSRSPLTLFEDEWRTPLSLAVAARALVSLALSRCRGVIHIGGPERMSRLEMGQRLAAHLGLDASAIKAFRRDSVPAVEPRPRDTSLDSSRWRSQFPDVAWPGYEDALPEMGVA